MDALTAFHFLRPWWLLALPLWFWLSLYVWRKGQSGDGWAAVCDPALLSYLVGEHSGARERSNLALAALMLAGALALLALAGPAWQQLPQPVYRAQSALVIGLDLSRSMLAEDLKPDRLQRAKQKLQDILSLRREGQTALVVFAGAAFDVVPLTNDNKAILAMLDALEPSMMPTQGSRASTALAHAEAIFKRNAIKHGTVILLTDGVDADALDMAGKLVKKGHHVSIIGVGTKAGAPIPASGETGGFIKDSNGNIVIPHLDTDMLKQLADAGHGVYQTIRFDDADIHAIAGIKPSVTDAISKQEKLQTDLWREEGPWLLLLLLPILSLAFRRGVLLTLLLLPLVASPHNAHAMAWKDLWQTPDQQGQALMRDNKPEAAAKLFQNPDWKSAALYRAKKYKEAADALKSVDSADGWYNRGNALAKAGDLKGALDAYEHALKLDKTNKDAAFNRDLVKKAMQQSTKNKSKDQNQSDKKKNKTKRSKQQNDKQDKKEQGKAGGKDKDQDKSGSQQSKSQNSDQNKSGQQQGKKSGQDRQSSGDKQSDQQKAQQGQSEQHSAGQKKDHKKKDEQQARAKQHSDGKQQDRKKAAMGTEKDNNPKDKEKSAAMQQWLRRIPDDPGGLLRRKFQYQYQQNRLNRAGDQSW